MMGAVGSRKRRRMTSAVLTSLNGVVVVEEEEGAVERSGWEEVRRSFLEFSEMILSGNESIKAAVEERLVDLEAVERRLAVVDTVEWRLYGTRGLFLEVDGIIIEKFLDQGRFFFWVQIGRFGWQWKFFKACWVDRWRGDDIFS